MYSGKASFGSPVRTPTRDGDTRAADGWDGMSGYTTEDLERAVQFWSDKCENLAAQHLLEKLKVSICMDLLNRSQKSQFNNIYRAAPVRKSLEAGVKIENVNDRVKFEITKVKRDQN